MTELTSSGPAGGGAAGRDPRRSTRRRRLLITVAGGVAALAALGAAVAWLAWTGSQARAELAAARTSLPQVRAAILTGDGRAGAALAELRARSARADDLTHDPVWAVAGAVPVLGSPVATTSGMTRAVHRLADDGLPPLARAADTLHPARLLAGGGRTDVTGLAAAAPSLQQAATALADQRDAVALLEPSWVGPVREARAQLLGELTTLASASRDAAGAARLLPPMLGANGPRRYFVAFQNPAEARATGGLLDAFAIVEADHGAVRVVRTGANSQLPALRSTVTADVDPAFATRYGPLGATRAWLEANVSPHFPDVARTWEAMWRASTGERLDGAVALDPRALSAVLAATGPVTAPAVGAVDAARIEPLVLHDQYAMPQLGGQRKSLMLGVGAATIDALLAGHVAPTVLLQGLRGVAADGHVLVHSAQAAEQDRLVAAGIAGAVDASARPFAQAVVVNAAGNKLDSWLATGLHYRVDSCSGGRRAVDVTVTLRNGAPTSGLPDYVTVRSDAPGYRTVPGQNRAGLEVLVTRGATLRSATLDGGTLALTPAPGEFPDTLPDDYAAQFLSAGTSAGRPAYRLDLELRPGATRTLVLRLDEPVTAAPPLLPRQAMVLAPKVTADLGGCRPGEGGS